MTTPIVIPKIFIYTALPCEAKPLIARYKLTRDSAIRAFSVFRNGDIVLTVTGIGKTAMAAGVAYSQALFSQHPNSVFINIGIAGHKRYTVGSLFLIDKIADNDTGRNYYPPLVFTPPCPTANLVTFAKLQQSYPESALCDMEASGFYETATRFSTGELVQCLKIVSDNETSSSENIQPDQVSSMIAEYVPRMAETLDSLSNLAHLIGRPELDEFKQLTEHYRFSENEKIQLKKTDNAMAFVDQ